MLKRIVVGVLALALFGCDHAGDAGQAVPDTAEKAQVSGKVGVLHPAILPAYRLPGEEKVPGKQDAASDYRKAHPQWYAITEPPPAQFRPMKEWEPMQANIITYSNYLPGDNETAQTMADIVTGSLPAGDMWVIVNSDYARDDLVERITDAGITQQQIDEKITFFDIENDAIWMIDYGPFPMVDDATGDMIWQDFKYYHGRVLDDGISTRLGNRQNVTTYRMPLSLEGGNLQADGEEFCYTTERLYYYTGLDYDGVNEVFKKYLNCKETVVVKDITNDGTGHIDMFFKLGGKNVAFVGEYTVVEDATNKQRMDDNVEIIEALSYSSGGPGIKVYRIPMPHAGNAGGEKIPRTFINSTLFSSADGEYKVNLWPIYTVDKDLEAEALDAWEEGLPDWDHVGVISDQISLYSGAIHCVTRTVPAQPLKKYLADGECVNGACQSADGYDGACISGSEEDPGCWGPKWACLCNDCDNASCDIPDTCGDGTCDETESCFSCAADCACGVDEVCSPIVGECVSDTCGNGTCDDGETCMTCEKDCGCPQGQSCTYGICSADPCGGITYDGCCDGADTLIYCDEGELVTLGCQDAGCGWLANRNWYDCGGSGADPDGAMPRSCGEYDFPPGCEGKVCGDNGGGYSCGECEEGTACVDGQCGECTPDCTDLECGDDGCGGSCGECDTGLACEEGVCLPDEQPDCEGKECGPDGLDGSCGECDEGFACSDEGMCVEEIANPEGDEPDVISSDDIATESDTINGGEDTVGGADATGGEEPPAGKKDDGCTASGTGGSGTGMGLILLGFFLAVAVIRRKALVA